MSVQAMAWAIQQQIVKDHTTRHVLLCIANYAGNEGDSIFPSIARLSADTGLSRRAVQTNIRKLEELNILVRDDPAVAIAKIGRRDRTPICYRMNMIHGAQEMHPAEGDGALPVRPVEPDGAHLTTSRGASDDITGRTTCTQSTIEPSMNHQQEKSGAIAPYVFGVDQEAWDRYVAHRRTIKAKKLQPESAEQQQKWLAAQGDAEVQRKIVDYSERNGYTGLFELKKQKSDKPRGGKISRAVEALTNADSRIDLEEVSVEGLGNGTRALPQG